MAKFSLIALSSVALLAIGCRHSDNSLHVKGQQITVGNPRQLPYHSIPFAISRDGSRLAIIDGVENLESPDLDPILRVVDTKTLAPIGESMHLGGDFPGIAFDSTGAKLYAAKDEAYVRWDYVANTFEKVADTVPNIAPISPEDTCANWDHSLLYTRPGASSFYQQPDPKATAGSPGTVLAGGRCYAIPFTHTLGYDPYGNFWYQAGGKWTKIDRDGQKTSPAAGPASLTKDQTKARAKMHLTLTTDYTKFKDSLAQVQSVWLSDDSAVPDPLNPQVHYKAALVMSGADIFDYGFVPHQDAIYVVTATGSYLVPFTSESDEARAKKLKQRRQSSGG